MEVQWTVEGRTKDLSSFNSVGWSNFDMEAEIDFSASVISKVNCLSGQSLRQVGNRTIGTVKRAA